MLKQKTKQALSFVLALCIIVSMLAVGAVAASAAETDTAKTGDGSETTKPPAYDPNSATVGQYTEDQVDNSLLVRHTGKTSEILENSNYVRAQVDPNNYTTEEYSEYFHTTTSNQAVYEAMDFPYSEMQSNAKDYAADPNNQNPLAGFSYIDPNEMVIADCNRSNNFDTYLHTYESVDSLDNVQTNNFDALTKNTDDLFFHDDDNDWNTICSNTIGIDADGDGTDELAYFSLQQKENDNNNTGKGTYIRVQLYDRVPGGNGYVWSKVDDYHVIMQGSNYLYDKLSITDSKAYTSLAAGDYDGDGKEELAYYMPDKGSDDDAKDARVVIENFELTESGCSHSDLAKFYLKDLGATDYEMMDGYFGRDEYLPTVALSTTSTRLGNVLNPDPNTTSAKRYQTFDDLVVSVSIPLTYQAMDIVYPSVTAIFGQKDGSVQKLFQHEFTNITNVSVSPNYSNQRATGLNTCDTDLNGDGFKEILVAGYLQATYFNYYVLYDPAYICANIITYNYANSSYEMVWDTELILNQTKQQNAQLSGTDHILAPVPLCAGCFLPEKLDLKEQVFINGFIYDLKNTKISGKPLYYSYNSNGDKTNYIADTQPGCDKLNFPAGEVVFEEEFYYDLNGIVSQNARWYESCASGRFINGSHYDQIAVISGDQTGYGPATCCANISIISHSDTADSWQVKEHDNYFNERDRESHGSSLSVTFIDSEADSAVYRWMGSYCSYSAPALYAILQVPPYYKEANKMYAYDFNLVVGNSEDSAVDWGAGICAEGAVGGGTKIISAQATGELEWKHLNNKTWSHDRSLTRSLDLELEEDCAICYVTPIIVNVYEVYSTKPSEEALANSDAAYEAGSDTGKIQREIVEYTMMEEPIFSEIPISRYNEAVDKQGDEVVSDDTKLEKIDVTKLPKTTWGDPAAYDHNLDDAIGQTLEPNSTTDAVVEANVINDESLSLVGTEIEFGYGTTNETGNSLALQLGVKIGVDIKYFKMDLGIAFAGDAAKTEGTGSMDGISFGTTYYPPTAANQLLGSLSFDSDEETYSNGNTIIHYDAEEGTWYNYDAYSVCYKTSYNGGGTMGVYAHGFYTQMTNVTQELSEYADPADLNYVFPPEQPQNFSVQSVRKHDDGSLDVTLIWDTVNRNPHRKTDGYNIYMEDANENQVGKIHLQNKEGIINADPNSHYTTYTIHLGANDYRKENLNFYLAPAYCQPIGEDNHMLEGTISLAAKITDVDDINKNIVITEQPKPYRMAQDESDETATFSVAAEMAEDFHPTDGAVTFKWKKHSIQSDKWEDISEETLTEPGSDGKFRSSCAINVAGSEKWNVKDTVVYCEIKCGNTTQNTDLVNIDFANIYQASSWAQLQEQLNTAENGDAIRLLNDCTALDNDTALHVEEGKAVTLDLGGFTLNRGLADKSAATDGNVITNDGDLTITGNGTITGGNNTTAGGGIVNNGVLTIKSGTVTGNKSDSDGAGIWTSGALNLTDVSVTGNTSDTGNGGGIFYSAGTLSLSGTPVITGNTAGDGSNDLFINGESTLTIADKLTDNAKIGVCTSAPCNSAFTSGLNGNGSAANFISNDSGYKVTLNGDGEAVLRQRFMIGDVNLDGKVSIKDVTAIQRHLALIEPLTGDSLLTADANGSDDITIDDATCVQMYLAEYTDNTGKIGQLAD